MGIGAGSSSGVSGALSGFGAFGGGPGLFMGPGLSSLNCPSCTLLVCMVRLATLFYRRSDGKRSRANGEP
jgi:hypothetical protein